MEYCNMRNVFCKAEDPKEIMEVFAKKLREKYCIPSNKIIIDKKNNNIDCGYYHIHFCKEREWEIMSTTKPGCGYLTIPYNRLLLSKNGVRPEMCKLNHLFAIVTASVEEEIAMEKTNPMVTSQNIVTENPAPVIGVDLAQTEDQTAKVPEAVEEAVPVDEVIEEVSEPVEETALEEEPVDEIEEEALQEEEIIEAPPVKKQVIVRDNKVNKNPAAVNRHKQPEKLQFNI